MATPHRSPSFLLLPSHKLEFQHFNITFNTHHYPLRKNFRFCVCSAKNSRRGKKVKSNAELCSDIREFLSDVGLPEGHAPTMKELSAHGRTDLAHIVRRRGYKFIRDLLSNPMEEESNGFTMEKQLAQGQDITSYYAEGQDEKVEDIIEDSEIPVIQDSSTSGSIIPECNYSDHGYVLIKSSISEPQYAEWQTDEAKSVFQHEIEDSYLPTSTDKVDRHLEGQNEDSYLPTSTDKVDRHLEGQNEKVEDIVEDSEIPVTQDAPITAGVIPEYSYSHHGYMLVESPISKSRYAEWQTDEAKSVVQHEIEESSMPTSAEKVDQQNDRGVSTVEDDSFSQEVFFEDDSPSSVNAYAETNSDVVSCTSVEFSVNDSSAEKALENSQSQDEKVNSLAEDISLPARVSFSENPANYINVVPGPHPAVNSSLEDKVAKFILSGDLDSIEDDVYDMLDEGTEEGKGLSERNNEIEIQSKAPSEEIFEHVVSRSNAASASNGSLFMSEQYRCLGRVNHHVRDDDVPAESLASSDIMKDMYDEASNRENQVEINHLKFLLHQKEFELSLLTEQIEKEKVALSDLQMKAEEEISKAQKLVLEKDAEMHAVEESLSGLVEVNVQYSGEGEIVEVAGSFNGWHHPIKMDPQPYFSNADRTGSRKSRLWSTLLWLYPGVYEIKFIVDGHWTLDPEGELVTKDGICNNILRVVG